eukprot:TRINITY_DN3783_c0_g1_i2.p1 TRINITY_DN3783_c0_g1~~TRINITY_DN3783_c0_g1_i2.p1  ORF type:complete len:1928 (-),score=268.69 TRINITY_DN3783_c0_g1_i2:249-6032(-)
MELEEGELLDEHENNNGNRGSNNDPKSDLMRLRALALQSKRKPSVVDNANKSAGVATSNSNSHPALYGQVRDASDGNGSPTTQRATYQLQQQNTSNRGASDKTATLSSSGTVTNMDEDMDTDSEEEEHQPQPRLLDVASTLAQFKHDAANKEKSELKAVSEQSTQVLLYGHPDTHTEVAALIPEPSLPGRSELDTAFNHFDAEFLATSEDVKLYRQHSAVMHQKRQIVHSTEHEALIVKQRLSDCENISQQLQTKERALLAELAIIQSMRGETDLDVQNALGELQRMEQIHVEKQLEMKSLTDSLKRERCRIGQMYAEWKVAKLLNNKYASKQEMTRAPAAVQHTAAAMPTAAVPAIQLPSFGAVSPTLTSSPPILSVPVMPLSPISPLTPSAVTTQAPQKITLTPTIPSPSLTTRSNTRTRPSDTQSKSALPDKSVKKNQASSLSPLPNTIVTAPNDANKPHAATLPGTVEQHRIPLSPTQPNTTTQAPNDQPPQSDKPLTPAVKKNQTTLSAPQPNAKAAQLAAPATSAVEKIQEPVVVPQQSPIIGAPNSTQQKPQATVPIAEQPWPSSQKDTESLQIKTTEAVQPSAAVPSTPANSAVQETGPGQKTAPPPAKQTAQPKPTPTAKVTPHPKQKPKPAQPKLSPAAKTAQPPINSQANSNTTITLQPEPTAPTAAPKTTAAQNPLSNRATTPPPPSAKPDVPRPRETTPPAPKAREKAKVPLAIKLSSNVITNETQLSVLREAALRSAVQHSAAERAKEALAKQPSQSSQSANPVPQTRPSAPTPQPTKSSSDVPMTTVSAPAVPQPMTPVETKTQKQFIRRATQTICSSPSTTVALPAYGGFLNIPFFTDGDIQSSPFAHPRVGLFQVQQRAEPPVIDLTDDEPEVIKKPPEVHTIDDEIPQVNGQNAGEWSRIEGYTSVLEHFRSSRLHPLNAARLTDLALSHKIDPKNTFCRFELHGTCNEDACPLQHIEDIAVSDGELLEDIALYGQVLAPELFSRLPAIIHQALGEAKQELAATSPAPSQITLLAVQKLIAVLNKSRKDAECPPHYLVMERRRDTLADRQKKQPKPQKEPASKHKSDGLKKRKRTPSTGEKDDSQHGAQQTSAIPTLKKKRSTGHFNELDYVPVYDTIEEQQEVARSHQDAGAKKPLERRTQDRTWNVEQDGSGATGDARYYAPKKTVEDYEKEVSQNKNNVVAWINSASLNIDAADDTQNTEASLKANIALAQMARGLEANPESIWLWKIYLDWFAARGRGGSTDLLESAVKFAPGSRIIWKMYIEAQTTTNTKIAVCKRALTGLIAAPATLTKERDVFDILLTLVHIYCTAESCQLALDILHSYVFLPPSSSPVLGPHFQCLLCLVYVHVLCFRQLPPEVTPFVGNVKADSANLASPAHQPPELQEGVPPLATSASLTPLLVPAYDYFMINWSLLRDGINTPSTSMNTDSASASPAIPPPMVPLSELHNIFGKLLALFPDVAVPCSIPLPVGLRGVSAKHQPAQKSSLEAVPSLPLFINYAQLSLVVNDAEASRDICQKYLRANPSVPELWFTYARLEEATGNYEDVQLIYERFLKRYSESFVFWYYFAAYHIRRGNREEAIAVLSRCVGQSTPRGLKTEPSDSVGYNYGRPSSATPSRSESRSLYQQLLQQKQREPSPSEKNYEKDVYLWLNFCLFESLLTFEDTNAKRTFEQGLVALARSNDRQLLWIQYMHLVVNSPNFDLPAGLGLIDRAFADLGAAEQFVPFTQTSPSTSSFADPRIERFVREEYVKAAYWQNDLVRIVVQQSKKKGDDKLSHIYSHVLMAVPHNAGLALDAADMELSHGHTFRAKPLLHNALRCNLTNISLWLAVVNIRMRERRIAEARHLLYNALSINPTVHALWKLLAQFEMEFGNQQELQAVVALAAKHDLSAEHVLGVPPDFLQKAA